MISLFSSALAKEPDRALDISEFFRMLREGDYSHLITPIRKHIERGDRNRYDEKKRHLPAVTISCCCLTRDATASPDEKDATPSGWLQADFDLKDNPILADPETLRAKREALINDPHVGGVFVGPSGEGLKAVIAIDGENHRQSFIAAEKYLLQTFHLKMDKATKDPMRLCFVSYDPDAIWDGEEASPIPIPEENNEDEEDDRWFPPVETTIDDIREMLQYIPPRPDYDEWLRIASAVWSVLPFGPGAQVLNEWSPEEKPGEYHAKHKARLTQIGIGTLVMEAKKGGFDASAAYQRSRWAGRIRFADPGEVTDYELREDTSATPKVAQLKTADIKKAFETSQFGDANFWCDWRIGKYTYNIHTKKWMRYDGRGIWVKEESNRAIIDMRDFLTSAYSAFAKEIAKQIAEVPHEGKGKDIRQTEIDSIAKRLAYLNKWDYMTGVEKFAIRLMNVEATKFDASPNILVLENGTLDFEAGMFREHRPEDYATIRSPITFDENAECPTWDRFLEMIIPDEDTREYIARAVGYSLTGLVHQDIMFFAYGKGANGKSTFLSVLKILLGDLMTTVPMSALLSAKSDANFDYHKASMQGKRLVMTDEIPENRSLAEHQVKSLVGGDPINARRPYESPYTFDPTHKLWLMGNHKPEIKGTDEGIWRRVHLIPFLHTIPEEERRPRHEVLAEFQNEAPGILNWAIRGFLQSCGGSLHPPAQVVQATREYRQDSDQFGTFLAEVLEPHEGTHTYVADVASLYVDWCERNGEKPRFTSTQKTKLALLERGVDVQPHCKTKKPTAMGVIIKSEDDSNILSFARHS